jgi:hypothetical protein
MPAIVRSLNRAAALIARPIAPMAGIGYLAAL